MGLAPNPPNGLSWRSTEEGVHCLKGTKIAPPSGGNVQAKAFERENIDVSLQRQCPLLIPHFQAHMFRIE